MLFVGAFTERDGVAGGNLTACRSLLRSPFARDAELDLIDSAQISVPPPGVSVRLGRAVQRAAAFFWHLETRRPDAALLFASTGASFVEKALCAAYAHLRGTPSMLFVRSGLFIDDCVRSARFARVAAFLLRRIDVILCQSESWRQFYHERFGIEISRLVVVENWLENDALLDLDPARPRPSPARVRILFLGRLEEYKGLDDLLDAFRVLQARIGASHDVHLVIAGRGTLEPELRRRIDREGDATSVTFAGWVHGEAKTELLRDSDIFVLPSHTEGMPNALLEAMAAGLPTVATPVGGIVDIVVPGEDGLLVPARDPTALAAAMQELAQDRGARIRLGIAAQRTARGRFSAQRAARQLMATVDSLMFQRAP